MVAATTSSTSPIRPKGMRERMRSRQVGSWSVLRVNSVLMNVGATALTVISCYASSMASTFVSCITPALLAP
jgi:hypothetical protein